MNGHGPEISGRGAVPLWKSIASAVFYGVVSSLMTFCNKSLSATFDFSYPLFLLWVQMATTQAALCVMHSGGIGGFVYPRITLRGLLAHVPVACLYVINAALAISSLQGMSIPTYGVLKRAGPLFILGINCNCRCRYGVLKRAGPLFILGINWANERFAKKKAHAHADSDIEAAKPGAAPPSGEGPGSGIVAAVLIIVCGTLVAGGNDLHLSAVTLRMALTSNVTQALYVTMVESKHKSSGGFSYGKTDPTLGLLAHNSLLSIPLLGVVVFVAGWVDGGKSWGFLAPAQYTPELIGIFVLATALGCSLNYTMFVCIRFNSALTTSLVGHAKTAVQTVIGFFVFAQEVQATYAYVAGVILNAVGAFLFSLAKYHETERKKGNVAMRGLGFWRWCLTSLGMAQSMQSRVSLHKATRL